MVCLSPFPAFRGVLASDLRLNVMLQLPPPNLEGIGRKSQCKGAPTLGLSIPWNLMSI